MNADLRLKNGGGLSAYRYQVLDIDAEKAGQSERVVVLVQKEQEITKEVVINPDLSAVGSVGRLGPVDIQPSEIREEHFSLLRVEFSA